MEFRENNFFKPNDTSSNFKFANISGFTKDIGYYSGKINEIKLFNDFERLILSKTLNNFNYTRYANEIRSYEDYTQENNTIGTKDVLSTSIQYIDGKHGIRQLELFDAKLSTKKGNVFATPRVSIYVDLINEFVDYNIYHIFDDISSVFGKTNKELLAIPSKELYKLSNTKNAPLGFAIQLKTGSVNKFVSYVNKIGTRINVERKIKRRFHYIHSEIIGDSKASRALLRSFYKIAPKNYLKEIPDEKLFDDLVRLVIHDNIDEFWDASKAIMNFFGAFSNESFIYSKLYENPDIARQIYDVLNDDKDKQGYCSFITALSCGFQKQTESNKTIDIIQLGGDYEIDSDLFFGESDSIRIKNDSVTYDRGTYTLSTPQVDLDTGIEYETEIGRETLLDKQYNPLDIVFIKNNDTGEVYFVSAIQVKLMADKSEWGEVVEWIQIGINILLIALPIGLFANGVRGLFLTLSIVEGSVALIDTVVKGFEYELRSISGGEEFLKLWNAFYNAVNIMSGVGVVPALGKFLLYGAKFILGLTGNALSEALSLLRFAVRKSALYKFLGHNYRIVVNVYKYPRISSFAAKLTRLQEKGVIIFEKTVKNARGKDEIRYMLSYKDEIIAEGKTGTELRQATKKFFGPNGKVMEEALEAAAKKAKRKSYFIKRRIEMQADDFRDVRSGGVYRPHEIESFIELELKYDGISRAALENEAGDIIMETGELAGKSLDPLGLAEGAIEPWGRSFNKQFKDFKRSINRHFEKIHAPKSGLPPLDIVVIDFKYMDEINSTLKQKVLDYIESPTFDYKQYINEKYLIKLNF